MTARTTISQAMMKRAIRAARAEGMAVVITPQGIVFAESDKIILPSPDQSEAAECDRAFGVTR